MNRFEVPSDSEVLDCLRVLGSKNVNPVALCEELMKHGHPRMQCQLAIQRTVERGYIRVGKDWRLTAFRESAAA